MKVFVPLSTFICGMVNHLETPQRQGPSGDDGGTDLFVQKMLGDPIFPSIFPSGEESSSAVPS